jgi:hypothetical protein
MISLFPNHDEHLQNFGVIPTDPRRSSGPRRGRDGASFWPDKQLRDGAGIELRGLGRERRELPRARPVAILKPNCHL